MTDDWGLFDKDGAAEPFCPECEGIVDWVDCDWCGGEGMSDHDCGEDCCACLYPEPNVTCDLCGGAGGWHWCPNQRCPAKQEKAV